MTKTKYLIISLLLLPFSALAAIPDDGAYQFLRDGEPLRGTGSVSFPSGELTEGAIITLSIEDGVVLHISSLVGGGFASQKCGNSGFEEEDSFYKSLGYSSAGISSLGISLPTLTYTHIGDGTFTVSESVNLDSNDQFENIRFGRRSATLGTLTFTAPDQGSLNLFIAFSYFTGDGITTEVCVIEETFEVEWLRKLANYGPPLTF